jgi:hypothetical protein
VVVVTTILTASTEERIAAAELAAELGLGLFLLHNPFTDLYEPGRVFCSCGDTACQKVGKHPRSAGWQEVAVFDRHELHRLVLENPVCNLGTVTGARHGIVVLDIDDRNGGFDSLDELESGREQGPLPSTFVVQTPSGGLHLYFALPEGVEGKTGAHVVGPGIDTRGRGGFVVFPPSVAASGLRYTVAPWSAATIAPLPSDLVSIAGRTVEGVAPSTSSLTLAPVDPSLSAREMLLRALDDVARAPSGHRNTTLNRRAFELGRWCAIGHLDPLDVVYGLWSAAKAAGLREREALSTVRSGLVRGVEAAQLHIDPAENRRLANQYADVYDRLAGRHG